MHLRDAPDGHRLEALFVTLTYRDIDGYRARHVAEYVKALKRSVTFELRYVWVLELQRRGAPHYHLVIWIPTIILLSLWFLRPFKATMIALQYQRQAGSA